MLIINRGKNQISNNLIQILIIDDNRQNSLLITHCLKTIKNCKFLMAESGEEGLEKLQTETVDLILLDIMMPGGIDGFETCKRLKNSNSTRDIPVIFITALDNVKDRIKGLQLGAVDYISKPFEPAEILARVNLHLKNNILQKQIQQQNLLLQEEIQIRAKIEKALWETQSTLTNIMNNIPGIAYRCKNDEHWTMELISIGCYKLTGYLPKEFTEREISFAQLIHPEDREKVREVIEKAVAQNQPYQLVYRILTKSGELKWVWEQGEEVFDENRSILVLEGLIVDITDQKEVEAALKRELKKTLLLKEITDEIRSSLDIGQIFQTAAEKIGKTFAASCCRIYSYIDSPSPKIPQVAEYLAPGEISPLNIPIPVSENSLAQVVLSQDKAVVINDIDTSPLLKNTKNWLVNFKLKSILIIRTSYLEKPNGIISLKQWNNYRHWTKDEIDLLESVASQMGIALAHGNLLKKEQDQSAELAEHNLTLQKMKTQLLEANQKLERLANLDGLTGIPNRRQFDEYLKQEWKRQSREQKPLSLIICDVDCFKSYNDTYGHQAGDDCLKKVAHLLQDGIKRPADLAARYGGEEFAVILPNTEGEGAFQLAIKLNQEIQQLKLPHTASNFGYVTVSFGVSCLIPSQEKCSQTLITLADAALYQAKNKGRNQVIFNVDSSLNPRNPRQQRKHTKTQ